MAKNKTNIKSRRTRGKDFERTLVTQSCRYRAAKDEPDKLSIDKLSIDPMDTSLPTAGSSTDPLHVPSGAGSFRSCRRVHQDRFIFRQVRVRSVSCRVHPRQVRFVPPTADSSQPLRIIQAAGSLDDLLESLPDRGMGRKSEWT